MGKKKKNEVTFRRDVTDICKRLRWLFYLNAYKLDLEWLTETVVASEQHKGNVAAEVYINDAYLRINIKLYRDAYMMYLDGLLVPLLVHEFAHSVVEPMYQYVLPVVPDAMVPHLQLMRERSVCMITNLVSADHIAKIKEP